MGSMNGTVKANEVLLLGLEQTGKTTFLKRLLDSSLDTKEDVQVEKTDGCILFFTITRVYIYLYIIFI